MPRRELDQYFTPEWAVDKLMEHLKTWGIMKSPRILEPCSGKGNISSAIRKKFDCVITNDLDPSMPADYFQDATRADLYREVVPDLVITNPPFSQALEVVQHSVESARIGAAILLRISFLEPTKARGPWLAKNPPSKIVVLPRISFTGDGRTDSVTCAWMIWDKTNILVEPGICVIPKED